MTSVQIQDIAMRLQAGKTRLQVDSRLVAAGDVFVALPGTVVDGAQFIPEAIRAGAAWIIGRPEALAKAQAQQASQSSSTIFIASEDPVATLAELAQAAFGTSSPHYKLIGLTGTNGKTTTSFMLEHIFQSMGLRTGVLGTISNRWPGHNEKALLTTPGCLEAHKNLGAMNKAGVDVAIMEVSSHALDQRRVAGLAFDGALFTNLSQDHLDYHQNLEDYFEAKMRLFTECPRQDKALAIGTDGEWGQRLYACLGKEAQKHCVAFGLNSPAGEWGQSYLQARVEACGPWGMQLVCTLYKTASGHAAEYCSEESWHISTPLIGLYNVENLLAAQAMVLALGHNPADCKALADFKGLPGRLERVENTFGIDVFVDFAHTPDALQQALSTLRDTGFERLVTVFGCGGNRDRRKRPLMGAAVARWSDVVVLTSDNPRDEDPLDIMNDAKAGLAGAKKLVCEPDRRRAIEQALLLALQEAKARPQAHVALLVAGKGHETTQEVSGVFHPFHDTQVIHELLGSIACS